MTTFSIITVTFNSADSLAVTIESILRQTYLSTNSSMEEEMTARKSSKNGIDLQTDLKSELGTVEWILIDGASQDETLQIANGYRNQMREMGMKVTIISEKDEGIYDAMNKGARLATGEVIGFINSGDWYEDNALEQIDRTFRSTHCDLTFGDICIHRQNGKPFLKRANRSRFQTSRNWNHPSTFVKTSILKAHPFLGKGIHDDYGFYLYVCKAGFQISLTHAVIANFQMGGASNNKSLQEARKRIKDRYLYCYRANGYSRLYIIECILIEAMKFLL